MIIGNELVAHTTKEINSHRNSSGEVVTKQLTVSGETLLQKWSAMAMQGILAAFPASQNITPVITEQVAKEATMFAKALINELNKEV